MKLGLLADIHEETGKLLRALEWLRPHTPDRIVVLGDVFDTGARLDEIVALLDSAGAIGVWGNHDYGLCRPGPEAEGLFSLRVLEFAASLQPWLELDDCLFTHLEPWRDPEDILALWEAEDLPDGPDRLARSFAATEQRILFTGHSHRWRISTPEGRLDWQGEAPIHLRTGRYLVTIAAVSDGFCALYDTGTGELLPGRPA
jgi:predicted phosphodiesterase